MTSVPGCSTTESRSNPAASTKSFKYPAELTPPFFPWGQVTADDQFLLCPGEGDIQQALFFSLILALDPLLLPVGNSMGPGPV